MSNRTHRDLVGERLKQNIVGGGVVEKVDQRTLSHPMETGCRGKSPSDCRESVCETLMETGCRDKS